MQLSKEIEKKVAEIHCFVEVEVAYCTTPYS